MNKFLLMLITVIILIVTVVCYKQTTETEEKFGGSYTGCIELGHERSMCKRIFEF